MWFNTALTQGEQIKLNERTEAQKTAESASQFSSKNEQFKTYIHTARKGRGEEEEKYKHIVRLKQTAAS